MLIRTRALVGISGVTPGVPSVQATEIVLVQVIESPLFWFGPSVRTRFGNCGPAPLKVMLLTMFENLKFPNVKTPLTLPPAWPPPGGVFTLLLSVVVHGVFPKVTCRP